MSAILITADALGYSVPSACWESFQIWARLDEREKVLVGLKAAEAFPPSQLPDVTTDAEAIAFVNAQDAPSRDQVLWCLMEYWELASSLGLQVAEFALEATRYADLSRQALGYTLKECDETSEDEVDSDGDAGPEPGTPG